MELNKAVLDCMQTLRRRLRDELGVAIQLSQSDALEALLAASQRSDSVRTRELAEELARLCRPQRPPAATAEHGQTALAASAPGNPNSERQARIYRGQRIYL